MTGFGSAHREDPDLRARVEVRSVNNRFLKVNVKAAPLLSAREAAIEKRVRDRISRGTVTISVHIALTEHPGGWTFNADAARTLRNALLAFAKAEGIPGDITIADLARWPAVFDPAEADEGIDDEAWMRIEATIDEALDRLVAMREQEGASLRGEFLARQEAIEAHLTAVRARAPVVVEEYRERLDDKLRALFADHDADVADADLIRDVALFADRCDVTEEIARLGSHLDQHGKLVRAGGTIGRRLEFILQEMLRETNTIGAKANDYAIAERVVEIKAEIDRLKEQVQNLE